MKTLTTLPLETASLMPHRPPMRFVDRVVHYEEGFSKVEAGPWESHLLADPQGGLDPLALLEMMAQGYAAARGYDALTKGEESGEGYLVGVKRFKVHGEAGITDALTVEVRETDTMDNFYLADTAVYRGSELLVECSLRVWAPPAGGAR